MAVITDPDLLDRNQVIFGTANRKISIYPITTGTQRGTQRTDITKTLGGNTLVSATSFATDGVLVNDIVVLKNGVDAGHYRVSNVTTVTLTVTHIDGATVSWAATESTRILSVYDNGAYISEGFGGDGNTDTGGVTPPSGGNLADGVTLQAVYSFAKEEWRVDSATVGGDNLIRHQFPFESITSESFEIGGGASHDIWNWFGDPADTHPYTRKKIRTAGWSEKNLAGTTLNEYAGIVTLGSLDFDARVYYQQVSTTTNPVDFTFRGVVNEAIRTYSAPSEDNLNYRTYLKLFVRKKARTYAQSEIADIGVTSLQTIVNRFPLSHVLDAAITATDAAILSTTPWRDSFLVPGGGADGTDGVTTVSTRNFSSATATFQTAGVVPGDTLVISAGAADLGSYTIETVSSETALVLVDDADFTTFAGGTGLTYAVRSYYRVANKTSGTVASYTTAGASNGIIETGTAGIGTITDTTGAHFLGSGAGNAAVVAGDVLWITSSTGNVGLYPVLDSTTAGASNPTTTVIYVDTSDQPFPGVLEAGVAYRVLAKGMYLQYKNVTDQLIYQTGSPANTSNIAFNASNGSYGNRPTITLTGNTWDSTVGPGTLLTVSFSENSGENDGIYTVHAQETSTIVSLVAGSVLVTNATDTTADIVAAHGFERKIGSATDPAAGYTFGYNWRVFGNNGSLSQVFQFVQHQLRQTTDIDYGSGTARGDITDLLMAFSTPTGTTFNMYIDDLNVNDINNATFQDATDTNRNFPFTASGSLVFNSNLTNDASAKYWLFFSNDDAGSNLGYDYGTANAIIVQDATGISITGNVNGAGNHTGVAGSVDSAGNTTIPFSYAYDTNVQRGGGSAMTTAPVTLVAIGLTTAQFVISTGSITRATGITLSAVAALERNYFT